MIRRWAMALDFAQGGVHVLEPAYTVPGLVWASTSTPTHPEQSGTTSSTSPVPERNSSEFEWGQGNGNPYLARHPREKIWEFKRRAAWAYHIPLFKPLTNIFVSAVLKTGPERNIPPGWDAYCSDVNLSGSSINPFIREALKIGMHFGRCHAVTDMEPPSDGRPAVSVADQRAKGMRAYSYLISPLDLIDWSLDDKRQFIWANIREDAPDNRLPGQNYKSPRNQYRIWYRDHWELYMQANDGDTAQTLVAQGPNPLGRVPIRTLYTHRGITTLFDCESPLADVVDIDRTIFNKLSLMDEIINKQTFSVLAVGRRDGGPVGDFELSPSSGLFYDAEAGPPLFLSPDAAQLLAILQVIQWLFESARTHSEVGRGAAEASKEARSAAALSAESGDKNNLLASLAESTEAFERGIYQDAADWEGISGVPTVAYSRKFDLRSVNQQIADLTQLGIAMVSARARTFLAKPIVGKMMRELGATDEDVKTAVDATEIESAPITRSPSPSQDQQAMTRGGEGRQW
jgi:hypothetical protein